jgi:transcription elongation GreA/GreB family factor
LSIDIVPDSSADFNLGFLGTGTPLAKALIGEKVGTIIPYLKDDIYSIEILAVGPSTVKPDEDADQKRQANLERAKREVEHTNAILFASSFTGKWGDYDPDSVPKDKEPEKDESTE